MAEARRLHELSHAQKRILWGDKSYPGTAVGNIANTMRFAGVEDPALLEGAVKAVIASHDAFRLRMVETDDGGVPRTLQYLAPPGEVPVRRVAFDGPSAEADLEAWAEREATVPFELYERPLWDAAILTTPAGPPVFYLKLHHLVSDGGTFSLLARDVPIACSALREGRDAAVRRPSYLEYLVDEASYLASEEREKDRDYWVRTFTPAPPETDVAAYKPRTDSVASRRLTFTVPQELRARIHAYAKERRTSVFKLFLGALGIYLARVTRNDEVVVASVSGNRTTPAQRDMAGMFVSTMLLRLAADRKTTFAEFVEAASAQLNDVLKRHQKYPYDVFISDLREATGVTATRLTNVMITGHPDVADPGIDMRYRFRKAEQIALIVRVNYDGRDVKGALEISFDYLVDLFAPEEMEALFGRLLALLDDGLARPATPIGELEVLPAAERTRLLHDFNRTELPYPDDTTLHALFERTAERFPGRTALVFRDVRLTYRELDERANQLARRLLALGAGPETVVAIMAARSFETVVGILAVLKAGAAYAPIDYSYPKDRVRYMLDDGEARLLLYVGRLPEGLDAGCPVLDLTDEALYEGDASPLPPTGSPASLAYVIYTSGSTGQPKGVMIEHRSVLSLFAWDVANIALGPSDVCAEYSAFTFDPSVYSLFNPLLVGAELHVLDDERRMSIERLNAYLEENGVTVAFLPTQFSESFNELADNRSLRVLVTAGDRLNKYTPRGYRYINAYGPTEYTIFTTACDVDARHRRIPIGVPVANSRVYVVDAADRLQPIGAPGELCVAGVGIARGYRNKPEKTAEKFVPCPFEPGSLMYRTGDLVRWLPDGNLDFIGRIDFQVKIRGFRIELSEIEGQLLKHRAIRETVVIDRTDKTGNKYLCAYFVSERELPAQELKELIKRDLPEYMVPAVFVRLPKMPLNTSGKVDRKALPEPAPQGEAKRRPEPPANEAEIEVLALFSQLFDQKDLGVLDDFFELGGHSLKAAVLQSHLLRRFGASVSLQEVFKNPTPRSLAQLVAGAARPAVEGLAVVAAEEVFPLSAAQQRLYVLAQMEPGSVTYNVPLGLLVDGPLDQERLAAAIDQVVLRHEALRTSFVAVDGEVRQKVHADLHVRKVYREADVSAEPVSLLREFVRPFDLAKAPLFRVELVRLADGRHVLLLDFHHIVLDGLSASILTSEVWDLYVGERLAPVAHQYRDYVAWQRRLAETGALARQEAFWVDLFGGVPPQPIDLPTDHPRKSGLDFAGSRVRFSLEPETLERLRALTSRERCTLFMTLLTAFSTVLHRYTAQDEVVVGVPSAGRTVPGTERMVGMFVNTLALRLQPVSEKTFRDHLLEVREVVLAANDAQDYQLDSLVERLAVKRTPGRNPLFDVMFALESDLITGTSVAGLTVTPVRSEVGIAKFDLTLTAYESKDGLSFDVEYRTGLFERGTIERLAGHFLNVLRDASRSPERQLGLVPLLGADETQTLLEAFNDDALDVPGGVTANELFSGAVERFPERTALVCGETRLTYRELEARANRLARRLQALGVGPESVVGVLGERSWEPVLAMLAALKAGGAYTTIDPSYPAERVSYMLADAAAKALLCVGRVPEGLRFAGTVVDLLDPSTYLDGDPSPLPVTNRADNVAYVIYTSGSTGQPKGVVIEHRSLVNLLFWDRARISRVTEADRVAEYPSFAFDASVRSIYQALTAGAELHVLPEELRLDPLRLNDYFESNGITLVDLPAQFAEIFSEMVDNRSLRVVTTGADRLTRFTPRGYTLVNEYGPTEYTVVTTAYPVDTRHERIPIGKPVANTRLLVLDRRGNLCPIGVPGELCVSGAGLAREYLGKPEKTAEKFVESPFSEGERMYRTGDLVRWLADGNVDFIGRIDFQVKIRGFRIELAEIEGKLLEVPGVKEAIVKDWPDASGNRYLAAYLVSEREVPVDELKRTLLAHLPAYMVPAAFTRLPRMPLNSSGKVDRKGLPEPALTEAPAKGHVEPRDEKERKVAAAWREVLGLPRVGAFDNFFDLGGHSLKGIAVVARLQKEFRVTINDIFEHQTVAELAARITPIEDNLATRLVRLKDALTRRIEDERLSPPLHRLAAGREAYLERAAADEALDLGPRRGYRDVLLTGATGYLGAYLLRTLLETTEARVRCIVRAPDDAEARRRLEAKAAYYFGPELLSRHAGRVEVLAGDLAREALGLSPSAYAALAGQTDAILHSAALVKHYGRAADFHDANVVSTERLIELARAGRSKDLHLVSTVSVGSGRLPGVPLAAYTEYDLDLGQQIANLYVKTKLEGEVAAIRARDTGLVANVYRVGNLIFESQGGRLQENIDENAFFGRVRAFLNLGTVLTDEDDAELSYIDDVARAIVLLMDRTALANQVFHVGNPAPYRLSELLAAPQLGLSLDGLPAGPFIDHLVKQYETKRMHPHVEAVLLHKGWLDDAGERTRFVLLQDRTDRLLARLGFAWADLPMESLRKMVLHAFAERLAFLRAHPLARAMKPGDLERIACAARARVYGTDDVVIREGTPAADLYLLEDGFAEESKRSLYGWTGTLRVLGPRGFVGLESLFPGRRYTISVEGASEELAALQLPGRLVADAMRSSPELALVVLGLTVERVNQLETLYVSA